jgi:hypothetical protein
MARDSHVASRESINRELALLALSRYITVISIIHNAKTKMLRGKQNRSTGKLPKHNCATIDNVANPTNMQPLVNDFLYDANIAITGVKGNLIFWNIDYLTTKILANPMDCNVLMANHRWCA